jgi:phosphosulfolactate synthase (CoM biosynthesis protein A)
MTPDEVRKVFHEYGEYTECIGFRWGVARDIKEDEVDNSEKWRKI